MESIDKKINRLIILIGKYEAEKEFGMVRVCQKEVNALLMIKHGRAAA